jgi:hypothetical protein
LKLHLNRNRRVLKLSRLLKILRRRHCESSERKSARLAKQRMLRMKQRLLRRHLKA